MQASLFDAMQTPLPAAARHYWASGLNILPLAGKQPRVRSWRRWIDERQPRDAVRAWPRARHSNIGIILGQVSGGLVVIDLDGLEAVRTFTARFPQLTQTLTVITGSGVGRHLYYWCQDTRTVRMPGVEVRGDGTYVVAPPSVHPDTGRRYGVDPGAPPAPARLELDAVRAWIRAQRAAPTLPAPARPRVVHTSAWAEAALRGELVRLAGTRRNFNDALYRAALKLGSIVADGTLSQTRVAYELYAAAVAAGYVARDGDRQTRATIGSGLRNGLNHPRSLSR